MDKRRSSKKHTEKIWERSAAGLLIPVGHITDATTTSSTTFVDVKRRAEAIENLYEQADVPLSPTCGLRKFIDKAVELADRWLSNRVHEANMQDVFAVMHMQRVAEAVLPLAELPGRRAYLRKLSSGEIDFFKRVESDAKNVLWELELWTRLKVRSAAVALQDPPDVVVTFPIGDIGLACKKVYSEANIEKVLSQAAKQVRHYKAGVVALNIDDLIPANMVLAVQGERDLHRMLHDRNAQFLQRHERHFRRYLSRERFAAVLVAIQAVADVRSWEVRFNNAFQALVWTLPALSEEKRSLVTQLGHIMTQ